jgi:long-chain fatty acid transport protein
VGGAPLQGGNGVNGGDVALVPNFYYMFSWDENLKFGIGLNAPYGLATEYEKGWVGRYHALRSELTTINLNPAIAYKVNDVLSIGAGLNVQYADVTLTNNLDFSTICLGTLPQAVALATCNALGLATPGNPATDGYAKLVGNSLAFGFNLGFTLEPIEGTRLGAHYRSHIEHDVKGSAHFLTPSRQFTQLTGAFVDTDAKASLPAPDTVSFGFTQAIGSEWSLMGDITWTQWSRFDSLTVDFENVAQPTSSAPTLWDDTFRYSLGASYKPNAGDWTYRLGFAYDESPISVLESRTPRIPDVDRIWMSFGASYQFTDALSLDFGYAHLFLDNAKFNNAEATGHVLVGQSELDIDIFALQLAISMP